MKWEVGSVERNIYVYVLGETKGIRVGSQLKSWIVLVVAVNAASRLWTRDHQYSGLYSCAPAL